MKKFVLTSLFCFCSITSFSHTVLNDVPKDSRMDFKKTVENEKKSKNPDYKESMFLIYCFKSGTETYAKGTESSEYPYYSDCSTVIPLPNDRSKINSKQFKEFKKKWIKIAKRLANAKNEEEQNKIFSEFAKLVDKYENLDLLYTGPLYPCDGEC